MLETKMKSNELELQAECMLVSGEIFKEYYKYTATSETGSSYKYSISCAILLLSGKIA